MRAKIGKGPTREECFEARPVVDAALAREDRCNEAAALLARGQNTTAELSLNGLPLTSSRDLRALRRCVEGLLLVAPTALAFAFA